MVESTDCRDLLASFDAGSGLQFKYAWKPDDPLLDDFYPGYDQSFVIESEKEELQGFKDCLALNLGPAYEKLSGRYGPYREYILLAKEKNGTVMGGANFICLSLQNFSGKLELVISVNLNYIFILPAYRGKGLLRPILNAGAHLALETIQHSAGAQPVIFFEQNDPVRMSAEDYETDSLQSGLDQVQRIAIWAKVGARIIDFPYVQPALSKDQEADNNLLLCVMGESVGTYLDPCLLKAHLERFFQISVLKDEAAVATSQDAMLQLSMLQTLCAQGSRLQLVNAGIWASQSMELGKSVIGKADSLRKLIQFDH
jgi:hypothetical protein